MKRLAKKTAGVLSCMMLLANSTAMAMTFSQPVKLGTVFNTPSGGFIFEGASSNTGKAYTNRQWSKKEIYEKGVAMFGADGEALFVHYDDSKELNVMYGNEGGKNTFSYRMFEMFYEIIQIKTDSELVLYALNRFASGNGSSNWIILGRKADGVFVKYFEVDDIRKQYFPDPRRHRYVVFGEIQTRGDTIVIGYNYFYPKNDQKGEFRFKWDDKAQWFGVEQVVY